MNKLYPLHIPKLICGCRVGVSDHFTQDEWVRINPMSWNSIKSFTNRPLIEFENPVSYKTNNHWYTHYAYRLAFFQRIRLPLGYVLSCKMKRNAYPLLGTPNFQKLNDLFDKYYPDLYKMDGENEDRKNYVKRELELLVLRLWCAGYGLFPGLGIEVVDDNLLDRAVKETKDISRKTWIRLLGRILKYEIDSPVGVPPQRYRKISSIDREHALWQKQLLYNEHCEFIGQLYNYVFGELLDRVSRLVIRESFTMVDGTSVISRRSFSRISVKTWSGQASCLRKLGVIAFSQGNRMLEELVNEGINSILKNEAIKWSMSHRNSFRSAVRCWLKWLTDTHQKDFKIHKIFPIAVRRTTKRFGKILDLKTSNILVETLLDEQSSHINENKLLEFRCRRACLIQIVTGARGSEVCLLLRNCIKQDHFGTYWMEFHKVKRGKVHRVRITEEVIYWVEQLKKLAPREKILAPDNSYSTGDGRREFRLFANAANDGPLTTDHVNKFLRRLQRSLWPDKKPKNFFTTHDFRRLQAIYMLLLGKSRDQIQDKLGHCRVESLLPYLATSPPEYQRWYAQMLKEGIWQNIDRGSTEHSNNEDNLAIVQRAKKPQLEDVEGIVQNLINKVLNDTKSFQVEEGRFLPINQVAAGFPRLAHNCDAPETLNCGHTELHCFSCDKYVPDADSLEVHKTEIFRYMLLAVHSEKSGQKGMMKETVALRAKNIKKLLEEAIPNLFERHFHIDPIQTEKLSEYMWKSARIYWRKYGAIKPFLNFYEALNYLKTGEIK